MGSAQAFMYWDADTNSFKIDKGAATEMHIGTHKICINVVHFNASYHYEYKDCFNLSVKDVKDPKEEMWTPPVILLNDTKRTAPNTKFIISDYGLEMGPYNPR